MADKQTQALKRLTKKLSALRKTLRKDERELLDALILGDEAAAEVKAHSLVGRADRVAKADVVAEVQAHRLAQAATAAAAAVSMRSLVSFDAMNGKYAIAAEEPEVEGHMLDAALALKVAALDPKVA
jgi:hypothetical protein